ncbi:tRNA pseudouridine(55) synthase [Babesia ovis]|uniref:tRNA pseudouridine(55) synthase n=1 Tax=Babesia ovis TaxID=5869 RepID=A0A9W5WTS7_BABOV|nr:tRNA pseudouridine(55) synthase [Babesia ovis]
MTAEGVLAIGIGRGTKLLSSYLKGEYQAMDSHLWNVGNKKYEATGVLGYETDTLDIHGNTLKEAPWEHVTDEAFDEAMSSMKGEYDQIPPLYSSKKYNGKRLRDYAIKNISVDVKPAKIIVHSIERVRTPGEELPKFGLRVSCSGGTYVRSIIRDIAYKLGTLGTMRSLVRTFKHNLSVDNSINVETIDYETIVQNIITPNAM